MQIADYFQSGGTNAEDYAIGLQSEFQQIPGHDIGQFPGLDPNELVSSFMHPLFDCSTMDLRISVVVVENQKP